MLICAGEHGLAARTEDALQDRATVFLSGGLRGLLVADGTILRAKALVHVVRRGADSARVC